jgi:hypothetical protein
MSGLGRGVRPLRSLRGAGRLLGVLGHAGAVAAPATFENASCFGGPILKLSNRLMMVCYLNAVLCHSLSVARFQVTVLGGSISCLVTLMVLDFGRVIYLT